MKRGLIARARTMRESAADRARARGLNQAASVGHAGDQGERAAVGGLHRAGVGHGVGRGDLQRGALVGVDRSLVVEKEGEAGVVDAELA